MHRNGAYGALVELKFSLKPNEDRILKDTSAAVEAWRRAVEAIAQTGGLPSGAWRPLATAVWPSRSGSVDDRFQRSLPDESIGFTAVAKAGELLADTGIDAIVALNVDESERWLLLGSIDELARQAENPGRSWIRRHSARIAASKRPTRRSRE